MVTKNKVSSAERRFRHLLMAKSHFQVVKHYMKNGHWTRNWTKWFLEYV